MSRLRLLWGATTLAILAVLGFAGWILSLPAATAVAQAPVVPQTEADALLAALKSTKGERPLIAILGINDATETTDYLLPSGILRRADVADVMMLATGPGPVRLYPLLQVIPDATIAVVSGAKYRESSMTRLAILTSASSPSE
ncbi:hypothetical protein GCM10027565_15750 [Bordetella tumulicola]